MTGDATGATPRKNFGEATELYTGGAYLENNRDWHVEDSPWKAAQIEKLLKANHVTCGTMAEVGCGAGEILRQLSLVYPTTTFEGFELSPQAYALCKPRESDRLRFHLKNLADEDVRFDCLLCIDVFEHIDDYMGFLRAIRSKADLKVFHIPLDISLSSVLRVTPILRARETVGHLHYFTRETALATLRDCGYEILDSVYTKAFLDLPSPSLKRILARWPRRMLHAISPHLAVRLLGGCSLLVLAR